MKATSGSHGMWWWIEQAEHGLVDSRDINISFSQTATEYNGIIAAGCSNVDLLLDSLLNNNVTRDGLEFW